jgi:hypothetical protein
MYYCTVKEGNLIMFGYTNWKGVMSVRKAIVKEFYFGASEYHEEYQMMIRAFDVDKLAERTFAVKDMKEVEVIEF